MKVLRNVPKSYVGSDVASIASVLNTGYVLLPAFLIIALLSQLIEGDLNIVVIAVISLIFSLFARHQFLKGHLRRSVIWLAFFLNILLTATCSLGNGINDIAIIGFPIIVGFSGIILDQKQLAITSILSITGILWLVAAEYLGIYTPASNLIGSAWDFLVSSLFVVLGGVVAFSLASNMKSALKDAQREVLASKSEADNLELETREKLEIIEEIHRTVINSLNHIQQLMEHRQSDNAKLRPVYEGIKRKVTVIEVAHNILLAEQTPIMLDLRELTSKLLNESKEKLETPALHFDSDNSSHFVPLDMAINYGICLLELINEVDKATNERLVIQLLMDNEQIQLILSGFTEADPSDSGIVIDLLTKQLKGTLIKSDTEFILSFNHTEDS